MKRSAAVMMMAAGMLSACGSSGGGTDGGSDAGETKGAVYAMMVQVYGTDDRTVYVSLSDTVDISSVNLDTAREFPGVANMATIGGKLYVSSGSAPSITEFDIAADRSWKEERTLSFANFPLMDNANFYYQFVVDDEHVVFPYSGTKRILWNPKEMTITKELTDTTLMNKEAGMTLEAGGNRNSVHYESSVMQTFFYHDTDWNSYGTQSHVVTYKSDFSEDKVLDVACPALTLGTRDEQGNTWFGTWGIPNPTLQKTGPATCAARVSPSLQIETFDLRTWTQGRWVNNFRYVGNGKAVANVLHHEALGVTDTKDLTQMQLDDLYLGGPHWKVWLFDVAAKTGAPVEGIDVAVGSGVQFAVLEGRTFVFVPYEDWGRTKIYEIGTDGKATVRADTKGDVFKWVKLR